MNLTTQIKRHGAKTVGGLTVASVVWIYATFATKDEVDHVKATDQAQWKQIAELCEDAAANDAIIRYYFGVTTNR